MEEGKVPTTPTTASVVAGIQVQEAIKMLHGLETLHGQGFVFDGLRHQSYLVTYTKMDDCPSHDSLGPIETLSSSVIETTAGDFLERVRSDLGPDAVIESNHDLLSGLTCAACQQTYARLASLGKVTEADGRCPQCGEPCAPQIYHTIGPDAPVLDKTLFELGVPLWDIVLGRAGTKQLGYEFAGDRRAVLGPLAEGD
jgi:adenylyltransferase/sulfurtransferase